MALFFPRLARIAAAGALLVAAAAAATAPSAVDAAVRGRARGRRTDCGSCGRATWTGGCVPTPATCTGPQRGICGVAPAAGGASANGGQGGWWLHRRQRVAYNCVPSAADGAAGAAGVAAAYLATIRRVYAPLAGTLEGAAALAAAGAVPPNTFSANPVGRIHPLGTFPGLAETSEYFYGITSFTRLQLDRG